MQFVVTAYWLALSIWFGGAIFVAVATPIVFQTVRENDPALPRVSSGNLAGEHANLLAGTIVANLIGRLAGIQVFCAAGLLVSIAAQWFLLDSPDAGEKVSIIARSALDLAATGILVYQRWILWPRAVRHRQAFIEKIDDPDAANAELELFEQAQQRGYTMLTVTVFLLLGMVLFGASIGRHGTTFTYQHQ